MIEPAKKQFAASGVKVLDTVLYNPDQPSYRAEVQRIFGASPAPDAVMCLGLLTDFVSIVREAVRMGATSKIMALSIMADAEGKFLAAVGGDVAEGIEHFQPAPPLGSASYKKFQKLMGATDVINASNVDPVEAIKEMTGGGVEYSFEAVGLKTTAEQCFQCLRPGGTATIIGMVPFGMKIELHGYDFLRERRIQGSSMGSNRFRFDMPKLLNAWKRGELKLDHLISSHIKLEEINEGYVKLKGGGVLRQLIDFGVAK
jgi:hypothetical protein